MVWLTYRQHRLELGTMLIGALAVALTCVAAAVYVAGVRVQVGLDAMAANHVAPERDQEHHHRLTPRCLAD